VRGARVDRLLLANGPFTSVVSTTERAGRLIPAASVSVQSATESNFFSNNSSTTRRYFGKRPAW